ncbi:MAG: 2-dehydropantoate 2-reductase [Bacteroidales bacterium]|nr:2-dehydropantoate 2-reductase [Bacteroidales bacterium]
MKKQDLKILVIGAGGIGGITAAHISKAGYDVEVVDNMPGYAEKIRNKGIHVFGTDGNFNVQLDAYSGINQVKGKKDIVLISTKANALPAIMKDVLPLLNSNSVVVSLQNGMCEDYLADIVGRNRVIGCVVGWGATAHAPGELEKTSAGDFEIGLLDGSKVENLQVVEEVLSSTAPVKYSDNIYGTLYSKLIINSCITTLGAISGMPLGKMLWKIKIRNLFIEIIREAVSVGNAAGITITNYAEKINFYKIANDNTLAGRIKKHLLLLLVGYKYRKLKSSSLQSLETGRATEVDFLNGYISKNAMRNNVRTPLNDMLISIVHEIESGSRNITDKNFESKFFNQYNFHL